MSFDKRLLLLKEFVQSKCQPIPAELPYVLFFSVSDGRNRARTFHAASKTFDVAWKQAKNHMFEYVRGKKVLGRHIRIDWVQSFQSTSWGSFLETLSKVKRTYFRYGIAFDANFSHAITEMECHANALFYGGSEYPQGAFNTKNFEAFIKYRFSSPISAPTSPDETVFTFTTAGAYCAEDSKVHFLPPPLSENTNLVSQGLYTGHREIPKLTPKLLTKIVTTSGKWLENQILPTGKFIYGYFPCFGRKINAYNTLRHASSLYSLLDIVSFVGKGSLIKSAERGLAYLANELIREYTSPEGLPMAFVVEESAHEVKLGASGVSLLAFAKYKELTGSTTYDSLMEKLAQGIAFMYDKKSKGFVHVLDSETLAVKDVFRTIYYDGEAIFGLLRYYKQGGDRQWLDFSKEVFEHFLQSKKHLTARDHWLSYAANEIFTAIPDPRYVTFGITNCMPLLDFILERETTYPTLLELMMAAQKLFALAKEKELDCLPSEHDREKFRDALHYRAHFLLNGFFWPEVAMFYKEPNSIKETFFIRHQSFRARIDDAQHYLSGLAAYGLLLADEDPYWEAPEDARSLGSRYRSAT